jgi:translation initiation factor IF-3
LRPRRGFDRPPEEPKTRINEAIRVPQVRLIDDDGSQIGLKSRDEALEYAWGKNLDLVEVAPDARPPVCRVMDYSKYKYEQEQKAKLARKHQSTITIKEIKLRPKVGDHDYQTKKGHVVRFLNNRDKVKVTIMFRGREMTHPERGRSLLLRLAEDVKELAVIESEPLQDGRNMVMMLAPIKPREPQPMPTERPPRDEAAPDAEAPAADEPAPDEPAPDAQAAEAPVVEAPAAEAPAPVEAAPTPEPAAADAKAPTGDVAAPATD